MRHRPPFRCEPCGHASPFPASCPGCGARPTDADGRALPAPRRPGLPWTEGRSRRALGLAVALFAIAFVPLLVLALNRGARAIAEVPLTLVGPALGVVVALGVVLAALALVHQRSHLTRWRAAQRGRLADLRVEHGSVRPIARLAPGTPVRFRGTIEAPDRVAAEHDLDDHRTASRFLIRDGSGVALFDDDAFELWSASGDADHVVLSDGDEVEVLARGQHRDDPERGRCFALEGAAEAPIHLVAIGVSSRR